FLRWEIESLANPPFGNVAIFWWPLHAIGHRSSKFGWKFGSMIPEVGVESPRWLSACSMGLPAGSRAPLGAPLRFQAKVMPEPDCQGNVEDGEPVRPTDGGGPGRRHQDGRPGCGRGPPARSPEGATDQDRRDDDVDRAREPAPHVGHVEEPEDARREADVGGKERAVRERRRAG